MQHLTTTTIIIILERYKIWNNTTKCKIKVVRIYIKQKIILTKIIFLTDKLLTYLQEN